MAVLVVVVVTVVAALLESVPNTEAQSNVALNKPSVGSTSNSLWATDGDTEDSSCAFLSGSFYSYVWWIVDLGNQYPIQSVRIFKKPNSFQHYEFQRFYIYVSDDNPYTDLDWTKGKQFLGQECLFQVSPLSSRAWNELPCTRNNITGRFVTLWIPTFSGYVFMCEFEAISAGEPLLLPPIFQNATIEVEISYGRRSLGSAYHTQTLIRPYHSLCVLECLTAKSDYYGGKTTISQLNAKSGVCQCILIGSFESSFEMFKFYDPNWSVMTLTSYK